MKKGSGAAGTIFAIIAVIRVIAYFVSHGSQAASDREFDSSRTTQVAAASVACRGRGGFFVAGQYDFTSTCVVPATRSAASGSAASGSAASGIATRSGSAVVGSGSAAVGTGSARTATGTAGTPSPLTATPWTDPAGTITLQYDSVWVPGQYGVPVQDGVLTLLGPGQVTVIVQEYVPTQSLEDDLHAGEQNLSSSSDYAYTFDPVRDGQVGGESAKIRGYRAQSKTTPTAPPVLGISYLVDHGGKRYRFTAIGATLDQHRAEVDAIIRSVRFTS